MEKETIESKAEALSSICKQVKEGLIEIEENQDSPEKFNTSN